MIAARGAINSVLEKLTPREAMILRLRYGLYKPVIMYADKSMNTRYRKRDYMTYQEIADEFGVTKERVRQLISKAERRVRMMPEAKELRWFLYDK